MVTMFGIKNCDTIKKARKWLEGHNVEYTFHDFRADGLTEGHINHWLSQVDWAVRLNKRSTTWRNLDDNTKTSVSAENVVALLCDNPTLVKRPVLQLQDTLLVGFKADDYAKSF